MERIIRKQKHRKKIIVILSVAGVIILSRLLLPYILLNYLNKKLRENRDYSGYINNIGISLLRGNYVIRDITIEKADSAKKEKDTIPFFTSPEINITVKWGALLKGNVETEIKIVHPVINFIKEEVKETVKKAEVIADTIDFQKKFRDLMPVTIEHFEIADGEVRYIDRNSRPRLNIVIKDIRVKAVNFSNVKNNDKLLPARLEAKSRAYGGAMELNINFHPLKKNPTFDMNASITNINMVLLNPFFKAYGNFDVKKGRFGLYTEFAAKEGNFEGYVKPVIRDLDVFQLTKEEGDATQLLWEGMIGASEEMVENQTKEQVATKIPITGKFRDPNISLLDAVGYLLRNAFVYALKPAIDNTISIGKVGKEKKEKKFLQKIFQKKEAIH